MTIRRLTSSDWPQIEAIIDSRPHFQSQGVEKDWLELFKKNYVFGRIDRPGVFFFGYFDGDELVAFRSIHATPVPGNMVFGVSYTMAGKATERWKDSQWPHVVVELLNYTVDFAWQLNTKVLWLPGPATMNRHRLIESPEATISTWERTDMGVISAGCKSGDQFIDEFVLVGSTLPQDQLIMRFVTPKSKFETEYEAGMHPPMGATPTPHEMPPRGGVPNLMTPPNAN